MIDDAVFRPHLRARRPSLLTAAASRAGHVAGWWDFLRGLGLRSTAWGERGLLDYAAIVGRARTPLETRRGLVRIACRMAGARRAALDLDGRGDGGLRRVATWPEALLVHCDRAGHTGTTVSMITDAVGPKRARTEWIDGDDPGLSIPLAWQGTAIGWLRLYGRQRAIDAATLRRLEALCLTAALAESRWRDAEPSPDVVIRDPHTGLYLQPFLDATLSHTLAQSRRRGEELALLYLAPDRFDSVRRTLGSDLADAAFQRLARAVIETLRTSDVVARVDRDRLAAVLPTVTPGDAMRIAVRLTKIVAEAGLTAATATPLTASVGVAAYPDHADDVEPLRRAAAHALKTAQARGRGRVALALPCPVEA